MVFLADLAVAVAVLEEVLLLEDQQHLVKEMLAVVTAVTQHLHIHLAVAVVLVLLVVVLQAQFAVVEVAVLLHQ
jgi:hypothetical protein